MTHGYAIYFVVFHQMAIYFQICEAHTEDNILYMTRLLACVVNFDCVASNALDDCPANQVCIQAEFNSKIKGFVKFNLSSR